MTLDVRAADVAAATAAFGSFLSQVFGWLPLALSVIASIMSIAWLTMQMLDRAERRRKGIP